MKILFVISSVNSKSDGMGGHYRSLLETAEQMRMAHDILIVNVGNAPARSLQDCGFPVTTLVHQEHAIARTTRELKKIVDHFRPDVLHAFDWIAFYWARIVSSSRGIRCCLTKCGGANPKYFPRAQDLVLFSEENRDYFSRLRTFRESRLHLIPNRIRQYPDDKERISEIDSMLEARGEVLRFLRIGRIGPYYLASSQQLLRLVQRLNRDGIPARAIFVGVVEDQEALMKLQEASEGKALFLHDPRYTRDSKGIINCADAVLGTGRSFMEAAAKNKLLLSPSAGWNIPALIGPSNFKTALYYNFSERVVFDEDTEDENYKSLRESLINPCERQQLEGFAQEMFERYFDSSQLLQRYEQVYDSATPAARAPLDVFLHMLFVLRAYLRK